MDFLLDESNLRAKILYTGSGISSSCLGIQCLSLVRAEPCCEGLESTGNVVSHTLEVCATAFIVKVLVYVKDQVRRAAVWVGDV